MSTVNTQKDACQHEKQIVVFTEQDLFEKGPSREPFRSEHYVLILITNGTFSISASLEQHTLRKGDLYLGVPQLCRLGSYSADVQLLGVKISADFMSRNGIFISGTDALIAFSLRNKPFYTVTEGEMYTIASLMGILHRKVRMIASPPFHQDVVQHCIMSLLYEAGSVFKRNNMNSAKRLNRKEELSSQFLHLLTLHFRKERSVQYYADILFVTSAHLTKVLREITGKTAGELIHDAVIMEARVQLLKVGMNVAQVAEALQFSDQSFFGKYFKKHTGISPTEYRSNILVGENALF